MTAGKWEIGMNVVYSVKGIVDKRRPKQGCEDMKKAGISQVLLQLPALCSAQELENGKEPSETEMLNLAEGVLRACKTTDLSLPVAYAPYYMPGTKCVDAGGKMKELAEQSLRICADYGVKKLIVRPLFPAMLLAEKAKAYGIKILLENQCKDVGGHLVRGLYSDPVQACEQIDALNKEAGAECFGFCLHVGTASLCGQNMYEMIKVLGKRLDAVVLSDCDGQKEGAMLPFTCVQKGSNRTDWLSLLRGLREIDFDGDLILDLSDTAAAFSPILRPQLLQLAKATGNYFKWQIELEQLLQKYPHRVLFGAGNMCRNYMKCYGEKYPPLFTCDNNNRLWGTEFSGLTVREPEALKEIPEDCAIFICNIYYREIEKQLRDMGIKNPIEFFNDEYMPSFYFDRI